MTATATTTHTTTTFHQHRQHPYGSHYRVMQGANNFSGRAAQEQQRRPIAHFSYHRHGGSSSDKVFSQSQGDTEMNTQHQQYLRRQQQQQHSSCAFPPPAGDELSSYSSRANSLEAASLQHRSAASQYQNHHFLNRSTAPDSPSRQHIPKRPRLLPEGGGALNDVMESLFQNIFSCGGCVGVQGVVNNNNNGNHGNRIPQQSTNGLFASKPLAAHRQRHPNSASAPYRGGSSKQQQHHPQQPQQQILLNPPPKVRRMTLEEAANDLDVAFMM